MIRSFEAARDRECLVWRDASYGYGAIEEMRRAWLGVFRDKDIAPGSVVGLQADFTPASISLHLALLGRGCVSSLVPTQAVEVAPYVEDGQIEGLFRVDADGAWTWERFGTRVDHPLLLGLREAGESGFTIFSSGSSGRPKAVLHGAERFLAKFDRPGKSLRTLAFLLFDHIAGQDTLFYTLCNRGALVLAERRDPLTVCRLIQDQRIEVLPAAPAFFNLLCLTHDYESLDLTSLKIITYGSEPMGQATLDRICRIFPEAQVEQKYGTSEFGAPRARSRGKDSLWLKLKDDETDAKVVDGMLWVRTETAMLGYLNAPSPFDEEGWYCTGDLVERDGDWLRILGRESDLIIVGGEKVYPQEVESAILELDPVADVAVKGEPHPMMGQIVTARVTLRRPLEEARLRKLIRKHCRARLAPYKIPARIEIADEPLTTGRQKKVRR